MANFATTNSTVGGTGTQQSVTTTYKTLLSVVGAQSAPRRGKIYDLMVGTNGTPADSTVEWDIARITALSSTGGTTIVALALDPADAACLATCTANSTTEGTVTANSDVLYIGTNARASYRWVAAPGSELVWPATSCAGFVLRAKGSYTGTATGNWYFQEQ